MHGGGEDGGAASRRTGRCPSPRTAVLAAIALLVSLYLKIEWGAPWMPPLPHMRPGLEARSGPPPHWVRRCTAGEVIMQVTKLEATDVRGCSAPEESLYRIIHLMHPMSGVFVDIGTNKAFESCAWFMLWAPELGITPARMHREFTLLLKVNMTARSCGACKDCWMAPVAFVKTRPFYNRDKQLRGMRVYGFDGNSNLVATINRAKNSLLRNLSLASLGEFWSIETMAFTDRSDGGPVKFAPNAEWGHVVIPGSNSTDKGPVIEVPSTSIDGFFKRKNIESAVMVKIDTEGHDFLVILGGRETLMKHKVLVLKFEYHWVNAWATFTLKNTAAMLEEWGYVCYLEGQRGLIRLNFGCWDDAFELRRWSNVWCLSTKSNLGLAISIAFDNCCSRTRPELIARRSRSASPSWICIAQAPPATPPPAARRPRPAPAMATPETVPQVTLLRSVASVRFDEGPALPVSARTIEAAIADDAASVRAELETSAAIGVTGSGKAVASVLKFATQALRHAVADIENQALARKSMQPHRVADADFHADMLDLIHSSPLLIQQSSSAELLARFPSKEALLSQGPDAYLLAVRNLLGVDEANAVTVAYQDLCFDGLPKPHNGLGKEPVATVASMLMQSLPFSSRKSGCEPIPVLNRVSGVIKPGRLTLVLGPPGAGKSVFLKVLAGRMFDNPGGSLYGQLAYNGRSVSELGQLAAWSAYVSQADEHQPLLTVRETLRFAWECRRKAVLAANPHADVLRDAEVDLILTILGLTRCADTVIGNDSLKGISGGEKRRVTLGEMLVTGSPVLCADSVSTGLDSSATYDITAFMSRACKVLNQTTVVALLQPPPEVIDLFDDVIVLAEGRIIYHGERQAMLGYFEGLGFRCPANVDLGDFVQDLPTPGGGRNYVDPSHPLHLNAPKTAIEFSARWQLSEQHRAMMRHVEVALTGPLSRAGSFDFDMQPQASFATLMLTCTGKSMRLRLREKAQLVAKLFVNCFMGGFYGWVFFDLSPSEWYMKAVLLFYIALFVLSSSFIQLQVVAKTKPIIIKQIDASFMTPLAYQLSEFLVAMPFVLCDIAAFGNVVYWTVGLSSNFIAFLTFLGITASFGAFVNSLNGFIPFVTRNEDSAVLLCVFYLVTAMIFCGLTPTLNVIPDWLVWLFWINPLAWVYQAFAINEYHSGGYYDEQPCHFTVGGHSISVDSKCGDYFLAARHVSTNDALVPWTFAMLWGQTLLFLVLSVVAVKRVRFDEARASRSGGGVAKLPHFTDVEAAAASERTTTLPLTSPLLGGQGDLPPMQQHQLVIHNVSYSINLGGENVQFLQDVSFWVTPGRMTALMGSSGAGKTTLMDVIAGRKTVGVSTGQILVDGLPKVQSQFVKYVAYVEQSGVHVPSSTVREALKFSADLRLPATLSSAARDQVVHETIRLLELDDVADQLCAWLSMEQNKRVTLGVELVANPSIVFADEPTSGLEARAAAMVMRVLAKVARSGRSVVCTIHQPSAAIFAYFDDLLLLKRGGQVVFFGELGQGAVNLIEFLQSVPGTPPLRPGANPASWMLEVIGAGTTGDGSGMDATGERIDYAREYNKSQLKLANDVRLKAECRKSLPQGWELWSSGSRQARIDNSVAMNSPYVRGLPVQVWALCIRLHKQYQRTPEFTLGRMVVTLFFGAVFGSAFWQNQMTNASDVQSRVILFFFILNVWTVFNLYVTIPFSLARRAVFYREQASEMYSAAAYVAADTLVEIPYSMVQTALGVAVAYFMIGLSVDALPYYFINALLLILLLTYLGMFFSWLLPDALSAQLVGIGFVQTLQIFSGGLVPYQNLAKIFRPIYWFSPYMYSLEVQVATQFHGDQTPICVPFGLPAHGSGLNLLERAYLCTLDGSNDLRKVTGVVQTVEHFVTEEFLPEFVYSRRFIDFAIVGIWIASCRILSVVVMKLVNHNRR